MFAAGRSSHPNLKENGGALQIAVKRFQIDYYPYHVAKGTFEHKLIYVDQYLLAFNHCQIYLEAVLLSLIVIQKCSDIF